MDIEQEGLKWQVGVWDRISPIYLRAIDNRFTEVVDAVVRRAALQSARQVLDLGTGTGSVAIKAASLVTPGGSVTAVDISPEMLDLARQRSASLGLNNIEFLEGRAEELPVTGRFDAVLASLSLMYLIDRAAAAREIAWVPGRLPIHLGFWLSWTAPESVRRSNRRRPSSPLKTSPRLGMCLPVLPPLS